MFKQSFCAIWLIPALCLSTLALGDEPSAEQAAPKKINLALKQNTATTNGGGASDLLSVTKFSPDNGNAKAGVRFSMSCTDAAGNTIKPDDVRFNQCITEAQEKQGQNFKGSKPTPSVGFSIGK